MFGKVNVGGTELNTGPKRPSFRGWSVLRGEYQALWTMTAGQGQLRQAFRVVHTNVEGNRDRQGRLKNSSDLKRQHFWNKLHSVVYYVTKSV